MTTKDVPHVVHGKPARAIRYIVVNGKPVIKHQQKIYITETIKVRGRTYYRIEQGDGLLYPADAFVEGELCLTPDPGHTRPSRPIRVRVGRSTREPM